MPDATDPRPEPKGCQFTLTSLLVFTLVAGILVLLLIPVLYHAGNTSSRNICALNLSQLYRGMQIYKSAFGNNTDYMPHTGDAFFTCLLGHSSVEHPGSYSAKAPLFGIPELFVCDRSGSDETSVTPGGKMGSSGSCVLVSGVISSHQFVA